MKNVNHKYEKFASHQKLVEWVGAFVSNAAAPTAVMAGHYMLAYSPASEQLAPLLSGTQHEDDATTARQAEIGDFSESSFKLGVDLVTKFAPAGIARIALLVNDHLFAQFQSHLVMNCDLASLKKEYYRRSNDIPRELAQLVNDDVQLTDLIIPNNASRKKDSTLPAESIFFSENVFKTHFAREKEVILAYPGFEKDKAGYASGKICFLRPNNTEIQVLPEDQDCGCLGTMIMLSLIHI